MLPFEGCWLRIERAEEHFRAFMACWTALIEKESFATVLSIDERGAGEIWIRPPHQSLPPTLALELGECLYQLRAALDGAVYDSAVRDASTPPANEDSLIFPITFSAAEFRACRGAISQLKKSRRQFIEALQPYKAARLTQKELIQHPSRALGILDQWARRASHRCLPVTGWWREDASAQLRVPARVNVSSLQPSASCFLDRQAKVASFQLQHYLHGMKIHGNHHLMIEAAVYEPPEPIAPSDTLRTRVIEMIAAVRTAVRALESA